MKTRQTVKLLHFEILQQVARNISTNSELCTDLLFDLYQKTGTNA